MAVIHASTKKGNICSVPVRPREGMFCQCLLGTLQGVFDVAARSNYCFFKSLSGVGVSSVPC